ncbi:OmpP1/FadL family transporter [Zhouia sp. PK063]|uniref:OmpP1/FadL family transporter n=1 Tax=Zhouia sp. PK063 TaxID=3373602 RepID=UPI00378EB9E2
MKNFFYAAVVMLLTTAYSYAGGYRVALQGNKQLAMGHTGVAIVNSAESVFFNPGALAFLEKKLNVSVGVSAVIANISFQNQQYGWYTETNHQTGTPFYAYGAFKINDWLTFGAGVYTPYGSSVEYPTNWEGSHLINNIELAAIFIQPTLSAKVTDFLSIGAGPIYVTGNVNFNRNINRYLTNTAGERSNVTIDGTGITAWGYNVGAFLKVTDQINLGVNYRSKIEMKAENKEAKFQNMPESIAAGYQNTTFDATLPLPAELTIGASYKINEKWLVAFDYNQAYWDAYKSLDVYFSNGSSSINPRNYKNSSTYRLGAQYIVSPTVTLRGGYYFDESPVQEGYFAPETPRNDSNNFTCGLTVNVTNSLAVDASFLYVHFKEVDASYDYFTDPINPAAGYQSFGGTYKNNAFVPGIGVSYSF